MSSFTIVDWCRGFHSRTRRNARDKCVGRVCFPPVASKFPADPKQTFDLCGFDLIWLHKTVAIIKSKNGHKRKDCSCHWIIRICQLTFQT